MEGGGNKSNKFTQVQHWQLNDAMLELYPDRANPGSLWGGAGRQEARLGGVIRAARRLKSFGWPALCGTNAVGATFSTLRLTRNPAVRPSNLTQPASSALR